MRPLIGSGWKMNSRPSEAEAYLRAIRPLVADVTDRDLFVLPPFTAISVARAELTGTNVAWGAQDVHPDDEGAHTGDISAPMLADLGCRYVECGHSERRRDHGETDALVAAKVAAILRWGMIAIVCVGEERRVPLAEARAFVLHQLEGCLGALGTDELTRVAVAYEPVWAIGSGASSADPGYVHKVHSAIHAWLSARGASTTRVVYGGSVDLDNAGPLLAAPGVDGLFVGRAALDVTVFAGIAHLSTTEEEPMLELDEAARAQHSPEPRLAIGADDAGYPLKQVVAAYLDEHEVVYEDVGTHSADPVDYPDIARIVAEGVRDKRYDRGILICGTGIGMAITANKVRGVRAAQAHDVYSAERARKSNDAQVLTMGARVIGPELAKVIVRAWLDSEFAGGASARKVAKIEELEAER